MVNPGAFSGMRLEFLLSQKALYADAARKGYPGDCVVDIQRRFFKRFPLDLPKNVEPTKAWLDAVDDGAADVEPESPDENTLSAEEFTLAMKEFEMRAEILDFRRQQIKRWLVYQYRKDSSEQDPAVKETLSCFVSRLTGIPLSKPRRAVPHNAWGKNHPSEVDQEFQERRQAFNVRKENFLSVRAAVTKELFNKLPSKTRKEWQGRVEKEYEQAVAQWEASLNNGASKDPADRQRCIEGLVNVVQPILDLICDHTGMKATMIVGGPEPADGGRLNVIGIHSGVSQGAIKGTFGELERAAYKDMVIPLFSRFLKKCYTKEECRAAALPNPGQSLSTIMESDMDGGNSASVHRGEQPSEGSANTVLSPPSGAPASSTPSPDTAPGPGLVVLPHAPPPRSSSPSPGPSPVPIPGLSPPPSPRPSPAPTPGPSPWQSPRPAPPPGPSPAPSPGPSPVPSPGPSPPLPFPSPAPSLPPPHPSPPPPPSPLPPPPFRPSSAPSPGSPSPSLCPSPPLPDVPAPPSSAPSQLKKTQKVVKAAVGQSRHATKGKDAKKRDLYDEDGNGRQPKRSRRDAPSSTSSPKWLASAMGMLRSSELGAEWAALVDSWEAYESAQAGHTGAERFVATGRPRDIGAWIQRARSPTYRPLVNDPSTWATEFTAWWTVLQPDWRKSADGSFLRGNGSLDELRKPGPNGLLSVLAALFFWGISSGGTGREQWLEAVEDVAWVVRGLA